MGDILDLAERSWRGEISPRELWRPTGKREEIAPGVLFLHTGVNVTVIRTTAGLVLVDTGSYASRARTFAAGRAMDTRRVRAAVYTHGHVDHACGLPPFLEEARDKGWPAPAIVGHRNIAARFDRYRHTAPWNGLSNSRQFSITATWPTAYDYPDVVYDATHRLEVGDLQLELTHARGETDDHTWIWWPARRILFTGDQGIRPAGAPQPRRRERSRAGHGRPRAARRHHSHRGPLVYRGRHIVVHCPGRKETVARTEALARARPRRAAHGPVEHDLSLPRALAQHPGGRADLHRRLPVERRARGRAQAHGGHGERALGARGEASHLQITVPVQPGNSGGPLVNAQGQLVGIVSASVDDVPFLMATGALPQSLNYAVKADYARPLFGQPAGRPAAQSRMETYERAKGATCRIEVDR